MPLPLIAIGAVGAHVAFSVGTGYLVDRYVFKSPTYTRGEMATDATLGLFGGGVVKPTASMIARSKRATQSHRFMTQQTQSVYGFASKQMVDTQLISGYMSMRHVTRGNIKPLAKSATAITIGRGIDRHLESRARSHRSPNSTATRDTRKPKVARESGETPRNSGRCPPGYYWSWKDNACMPSKYA